MYSVAGSVTVATSIGAMVYYVIKDARVYQKLVAEVRGGNATSGAFDYVAYGDIQRMVYL